MFSLQNRFAVLNDTHKERRKTGGQEGEEKVMRMSLVQRVGMSKNAAGNPLWYLAFHSNLVPTTHRFFTLLHSVCVLGLSSTRQLPDITETKHRQMLTRGRHSHCSVQLVCTCQHQFLCSALFCYYLLVRPDLRRYSVSHRFKWEKQKLENPKYLRVTGQLSWAYPRAAIVWNRDYHTAGTLWRPCSSSFTCKPRFLVSTKTVGEISGGQVAEFGCGGQV